MRMESMVKDMLEQKRKREAPLPTREDYIEQAVKELKALLPKNPKLASKKTDEKEAVIAERERVLKAVMAKVDTNHPEQDADFIAHVPEMHLSWSAMIMICKHHTLSEVYAKVIATIYKDAHTIEHEHIWLAMDNETLIKQLSFDGLNWTDYAKRVIEKQYPTLYQRLYAEERPMGFFS